MLDQTERLSELVNAFLNGQMNAPIFEEKFTAIHDLEDFELEEQYDKYFSQIRKILERYTFSQDDLRLHPDYYIDELQLKSMISTLKK